MPVAHLLHGFLGAGKTTAARRLERDHDAVRFTPDEWMARLFGEDPPADIFPEKAAAILALLQPMWLRCLQLGLDVVLDYGFWRRSDRDAVRRLVIETGATPILYLATCPTSTALSRVAARNRSPDRTLTITPATYETLQAKFEPLGEDEPHHPIPQNV